MTHFDAATSLRGTTCPVSSSDEIMLKLTAGAIRQGNMSVRKALHLLPDNVIGGSNREDAAIRQLTVVFHPGATVETDVAGDKMLLRCRGAVSDFFARASAKEGDVVRMWRDRTDAMHVEVVNQADHNKV